MTSADLERLRFLLAGLRETQPSQQTERPMLEAFKRAWPASKA